MVKITTTNQATSIDAIMRVEESLGRPLPAPYRAFLLNYNGGTPLPDTIDIKDASFKTTDVQVLHGVDDDIASCDLLSSWETLEGCKENQILPIAHDSFGHTFGLVLDDEDYGHVYYFDSRETPPKPYFVAKNFGEFLSQLRDYTPEELAEIDELAKESSSTESEGIQLVDVAFTFTGSRPVDAGLANAAAEYETTPRGYVWHRHQDGETLQLVPKDVHKQTGDPAGVSLRWRSS